MIEDKFKSIKIYKFTDDNWVVVFENENGIAHGVQYEKNGMRELFTHDKDGNLIK